MRGENINVSFKGKMISVNAFRVSFLGKFWGLMFSSRNKGNLIFGWGRDVRYWIHSFFVFYDFLAIWVDSKNNVIQVDYVRPFKTFVGCKRKYRYLIEIPVNKKNKSLIQKFI